MTGQLQIMPIGPGAPAQLVSEVQRALGVGVSGTYDLGTAHAVASFQEQAGLPVTGTVDPLTAGMLVRPPTSGLGGLGVWYDPTTWFSSPPPAPAASSASSGPDNLLAKQKLLSDALAQAEKEVAAVQQAALTPGDLNDSVRASLLRDTMTAQSRLATYAQGLTDAASNPSNSIWTDKAAFDQFLGELLSETKYATESGTAGDQYLLGLHDSSFWSALKDQAEKLFAQVGAAATSTVLGLTKIIVGVGLLLVAKSVLTQRTA